MARKTTGTTTGIRRKKARIPAPPKALRLLAEVSTVGRQKRHDSQSGCC